MAKMSPGEAARLRIQRQDAETNTVEAIRQLYASIVTKYEEDFHNERFMGALKEHLKEELGTEPSKQQVREALRDAVLDEIENNIKAGLNQHEAGTMPHNALLQNKVALELIRSEQVVKVKGLGEVKLYEAEKEVFKKIGDAKLAAIPEATRDVVWEAMNRVTHIERSTTSGGKEQGEYSLNQLNKVLKNPKPKEPELRTTKIPEFAEMLAAADADDRAAEEAAPDSPGWSGQKKAAVASGVVLSLALITVGGIKIFGGKKAEAPTPAPAEPPATHTRTVDPVIVPPKGADPKLNPTTYPGKYHDAPRELQSDAVRMVAAHKTAASKGLPTDVLEKTWEDFMVKYKTAKGADKTKVLGELSTFLDELETKMKEALAGKTGPGPKKTDPEPAPAMPGGGPAVAPPPRAVAMPPVKPEPAMKEHALWNLSQKELNEFGKDYIQPQMAAAGGYWEKFSSNKFDDNTPATHVFAYGQFKDTAEKRAAEFNKLYAEALKTTKPEDIDLKELGQKVTDAVPGGDNGGTLMDFKLDKNGKIREVVPVFVNTNTSLTGTTLTEKTGQHLVFSARTRDGANQEQYFVLRNSKGKQEAFNAIDALKLDATGFFFDKDDRNILPVQKETLDKLEGVRTKVKDGVDFVDILPEKVIRPEFRMLGIPKAPATGHTIHHKDWRVTTKIEAIRLGLTPGTAAQDVRSSIFTRIAVGDPDPAAKGTPATNFPGIPENTKPYSYSTPGLSPVHTTTERTDRTAANGQSPNAADKAVMGFMLQAPNITRTAGAKGPLDTAAPTGLLIVGDHAISKDKKGSRNNGPIELTFAKAQFDIDMGLANPTSRAQFTVGGYGRESSGPLQEFSMTQLKEQLQALAKDGTPHSSGEYTNLVAKRQEVFGRLGFKIDPTTGQVLGSTPAAKELPTGTPLVRFYTAGATGREHTTQLETYGGAALGFDNEIDGNKKKKNPMPTQVEPLGRELEPLKLISMGMGIDDFRKNPLKKFAQDMDGWDKYASGKEEKQKKNWERDVATGRRDNIPGRDV